MLNPHTSVAIVQIVLYIPIVPLAIYILVHNWNNGTRMPWFALVPFSIIRVVGGILVIILIQKDSTNLGLIISSIILLSIGLIPLIVASMGLLRLMIGNFPKDHVIWKIVKILRISIWAAVGLLISAGSLADQPSLLNANVALNKAAYICFSSVVVALIVLFTIFCARDTIERGRRIYLYGALMAMPPLVLRAIYGLISAFNSNNYYSVWNSLLGSATYFGCMALLPEYITVGIVASLGLYCTKHPLINAQEQSRSSLEDNPESKPSHQRRVAVHKAPRY